MAKEPEKTVKEPDTAKEAPKTETMKVDTSKATDAKAEKAEDAPKKALAGDGGVAPKNVPKARFREGPYDSLLSMTSLEPGQTGWLSLDDAGKPIGLYEFPPEPGADVSTCPVLIHAPTETGDQITTIGGAPLSDHMQPSSEKRFVPPDEAAIEENRARTSRRRFEHSHHNVHQAAEAAKKPEPVKEPAKG